MTATISSWDRLKLAKQNQQAAEHGLFLNLATDLIVAGNDGIRHITRDQVDSR